MPFVTPDTLGEYDVIVVGSGAAGGQSGYTLAMEGARVLMLEAGRKYVPESETPMFHRPARRRFAARRRPTSHSDSPTDGRRRWQVPGDPTSTPQTTMQGDRLVGAACWAGGQFTGRYSFRNGPYDFKPRSRDGLGYDWAISYEDLAPYYDRVEILIGSMAQRRARGHA